jgi:translation initiation factor 2B subunit (eIF-2B alpha/beta/delta family)/8-oxo-dGTP pyrophosphatase MutT (NUDIX family)
VLRRSGKLGTHRGKWSGVSGYLEAAEQPLTRAVTEIREELGLSAEQINLVRVGETLRAFDEETDTVWIIHPFLFETKQTEVQLDWENTEYRWIAPAELRLNETVPKLRETLDRVYYDLQSQPAALVDILTQLKGLEEDRIHGATYLGQQAVELLSQTVQVTDAQDTDTMFSHLLLVGLKLRRAQPAMANVWNLAGRLLHLVDQHRASGEPVEELKTLIPGLCKRVLEQTEGSCEDVARNTAQILPHGVVLTHSYSSAVLRSLELGFKSGRGFKVYATESYPGMEGKQLAKELIALDIPVTLIADSAVNSIIPNVGLVLVGADSVFRDGSLVHKVGTKEIAAAAKAQGIPLYSSCETTKFSVQDYLGERPQIPADLFDVTPPELVFNYVTEEGQLTPRQVEPQIRKMLKEIYT